MRGSDIAGRRQEVGSGQWGWKGALDTAVSGVLVLAAVTIVVEYLMDRDGRERPGSFVPLQEINDFSERAINGIVVGAVDAPVLITAFMDFQCPFCRSLSFRLDTLTKKYGVQLAVAFQHFPLSIHRFAVSAAIASECAERQGKFKQMHDLLFEKQDSIGVKSWEGYALEAGVQNRAAFNACTALPEQAFPRIAQGRSLGRLTGVRGAPAVWINENHIGRSDMIALQEWLSKLLKERP